MQNDQKYSDILELITTKEDYILITKELDLLSASLYELKEDNFSQVLTKISLPTSTLIKSLMLSEKNRETTLKGLKTELQKIKFLELTMARLPSEKLLKTILKWLSDKVAQKIALDIKVNPLLIAGATISFEGKFFDGSVLANLENVLTNYT